MNRKILQFSLNKFYPFIYSLVFILALMFVIDAIKKHGYHITYSVTQSMPKGFYLIIPTSVIRKGDIVEFIPPEHTLVFIKEKRWVPQNGRIIKYVFGIPGDHVCVLGQTIWINHKKVAPISKFYAKNKLLPQTKICGKLKQNQYLLLSTKNERSFDSRYFGAVDSSRILGRAVPIFCFD